VHAVALESITGGIFVVDDHPLCPGTISVINDQTDMYCCGPRYGTPVLAAKNDAFSRGPRKSTIGFDGLDFSGRKEFLRPWPSQKHGFGEVGLNEQSPLVTVPMNGGTEEDLLSEASFPSKICFGS
jgi:hypothetical protein